MLCWINKTMRLSITAVLFVMSGCVSDQMFIPKPLSDAPGGSAVVANVKIGDDEPKVVNKQLSELVHVPAMKHQLSLSSGSDSAINLPDEDVMLNADGLPLARFVDMALGEVLGVDYELDPILKNRADLITLHVNRPVPASRLLAMVESTLKLYRIGFVSNKGIIQVVPVGRLRSTPPLLKQFKELPRGGVYLGRVIEFIPLYYMASGEAGDLARMFIQAADGDEIRYIKSLNALMVIARPSSVRRFREAIALLDRPFLKGSYLRMVRPVYWKVDALSRTLSKMLKAQGVPVVSSGDVRNKGVYMLTIPVLNSMMVISPQKLWLKAVLDVVAALDVPEAAGSGKKVFVYYVKNGRADELGNIVGQILGQVGAGLSLPASGKAVAVSSSPPIKGLSGLGVIVDKKRNALLFVGEAVAYRAVLPILESLDRVPRQVMIEVTVAEVTLDASDQLGIEWQLNNIDNSNKLTGVLGTLGGLGAGGGGLTYALMNGAGAIRAQLSALATEGRSRILSTPKILTLDGETAKIQVGDQIPVVSQEVTNAQAVAGATTGLLRSFTYIDTGVILEITPTINEGGMVRIDISQEVSESGQAAGGGNPPIFKRNVSTKMIARSGQTIVIGGMIRHTKTNRATKVPWLGNIPYLGALFSSSSGSDRSTELLVMITPHVISNSEDARFISEAMREQLGWQDGVLD